MKEAYCSYEIAKLLKEKKFAEKVNGWYIPYDGEVKFFVFSQPEDVNNYKHAPWCVAAPTHQMAMAWLREVHKVLIVIDAYHADHWEGYIDSFEISIYSHASTIIVPNEIVHHTDYEDAVEAAIKYCLENMI